MNDIRFEKTKGQSAIEYLMTYGWMLLVVAIVGGAIFATVQGQCTQSTSGFTGTDVIVEDFGISNEEDDGSELQLEVRNGGSNSLDVENVTLEGHDDLEVDETIGVGNSEVITVDTDLISSDGCNDFDLGFEYNQGDLTGQSTSGSMTDSLELAN